MVVKLVFIAVIAFHCNRDERGHCQFQCDVYGWHKESVCQ